MPNDERLRRLVMLKIHAQEAVAKRVRLCSNGTSLLHSLWTVATNEVEYTEKRAGGGGAVRVDCRAGEYAGGWAVTSDFLNELLDFRWCLLRAILVVCAPLPALRNFVFAHQRLRLENRECAARADRHER